MKLIDANTVELDVTFTEADKSADGTALVDLAYSTVYIQTPSGILKSPQIPASSVTGGNAVATTVLVFAPANAKTDIVLWATETDVAGNESDKSSVVTMSIDRIGPAAPTNFTVA